MQRDKSAIAILAWKLRSCVEGDAECGRVRHEQDIRNDCLSNQVRALRGDCRIEILSDVRIWPAIETAVANRRDVIGHKIVSELIAFVNRRPQCVCSRIERETNGISQAACKYTFSGTVGIEFEYGSTPFVIVGSCVRCGAYGHVHLRACR